MFGDDCHDAYEEVTPHPAGCYASEAEKLLHIHYHCNGESGPVHYWCYYPETGMIDWFDLTQAARLIYPVYTGTITGKRKQRYGRK